MDDGRTFEGLNAKPAHTKMAASNMPHTGPASGWEELRSLQRHPGAAKDAWESLANTTKWQNGRTIDAGDDFAALPEKATDFAQIRAAELAEVIKCPEFVGLNYDSAHIVDPRASVLRQLLANGSTWEQAAAHFSTPAKSITAEQAKQALAQEQAKVANFNAELATLPAGTKFRVHPYGPLSPFCPGHSCKTNASEQTKVEFSGDAMQQIAALKDKGQDVDLTVVMGFWTPESASELPSSDMEITQYSTMCQEFVRQSGYAAAGGAGLILELGNETNVNRFTQIGDAQPFNTPAFASQSSPAAYAKVYARTASDLKAQFPAIKISLAGTAFYDPTYVSAVIEQVEATQSGLIDVISFHPYRDTVQNGTATIKNGQSVIGRDTYVEQLQRLRDLAGSVGAELTVGEVSLGDFGHSVNLAEQARNTELAIQTNTVNYIWPGSQILRYA